MEQPEEIHLAEILVAPKATNPAKDKDAPSDSTASQTPPAEDKQAADAAALATAEAKAKDLLDQIHKGASFEDIAKKYSDGLSAAQGGDLGVFKRGTMAKELDDKTFAMKAGEVSDVIRTKQGYVILKVIEHQDAGIPPFKTVEPKIVDQLYMQRLQPALRVYLTKLREDAYIDVKTGYVDSGASPNETKPIETAAKELPAKKLTKKKKKLWIL
jgi:peptidyl-prolyl cis-trans isomerase SurA